MIDSEFVSIAIVSQKSSCVEIELVEVFFLEVLEDHLNAVSKIIVFDIAFCELLKNVQNILVDCRSIDRFQIDVVEKRVC